MPHNAMDWSILGLAVVTAGAITYALWQVFFGPRALSLLVFRYLRKRRIAWVALMAVMLCTMMVIVVISVMGGWLQMFRATNHRLIGDISIYRDGLGGFPHYEEMITEVGKFPEVKAAAPELHSYGLMNILHQFGEGVEVVGVDLKRIEPVNGFDESLHLQPAVLEEKAKADEREAESISKNSPGDSGNDAASNLRADALALREKAKVFPSFDKPLSNLSYKNATSKKATADTTKLPGIIVGTGTILQKNEEGKYVRPDYMYVQQVRLTLLANSDDVSFNPASQFPVENFWIIDDSHTGVYQVDSKTVYIPFDLMQKDLQMDGSTDFDGPRCNEIDISLVDPAKLNEVRPKIQKTVNDICAKYGVAYSIDPIKVQTWEERQAEFLNAVEHEEGLLVMLFGIMCIVAVFLIFCIFFMIVMEKTRDIGIIKSVGVTSNGVAGIFLGYGLAIGVVGGGFGLLFGWLVIHNINWLHDGLYHLTKLRIWDPKTYLFDKIPDTVDPKTAMVIVSIAILSSVVGALVPAIRAARMNPVEAIRWE